jgi:hypothetical protein
MGLLTFAALATVALILGIALAKPPAQQQASLAPDAPAEDLAPAPPPARPAPPAEDSAPAPGPQAQEPVASAESEEPPAEDPAPAEDTDTAPVSTPALDVKGAAEYVRAFYADLEQRKFRAAWPRLADDLRQIHGSFENWERGFADTVSQSATDVTAKAVGPTTAQVLLTLTAVDRDKHECEVTRRFAILWRLDHTGDDWHAVHAEGKALKAPPTGVAASC